MAFRTKIFRSITDIEAAEWDSIVGGADLARSHAYLDAIEGASANDAQYFYPVVFRDGQIVAHACVYTISTDFRQMLPPFLQRAVSLLRRLWPRLLVVKVTECCSPLVADHSISTVDGADRPRLIRVIGESIATIAAQQGSPLLVIRDFMQDARAEFDVLLEDGFNLVSNMPLARIRVRWDSYDQYLGAMRSRYRKDVKRRLRRAARNGQTVKRIDDFGALAEIWVKQANVVYENTKGFKREQLAPEYYHKIDTKLGEKSQLLAVERAGELIAHGMLVNDDENTIATYFGREPGRPSSEWFQLMNEVIRVGIDRKSRFINLGLGSYDAKANVGAEVEPLFVYSKCRYRIVNWLMRTIPEKMNVRIESPKQVFHDSPNARR